MATVTAKVNKKTSFAGGADEIVCTLVTSSRNGVQIQADGIVLEECQVEIRLPNAASWQAVEVEEGSGPYSLVGVDWFLGEVKLSGVPAGDWLITFRQ